MLLYLSLPRGQVKHLKSESTVKEALSPVTVLLFGLRAMSVYYKMGKFKRLLPSIHQVFFVAGGGGRKFKQSFNPARQGAAVVADYV